MGLARPSREGILARQEAAAAQFAALRQHMEREDRYFRGEWEGDVAGVPQNTEVLLSPLPAALVNDAVDQVLADEPLVAAHLARRRHRGPRAVHLGSRGRRAARPRSGPPRPAARHLARLRRRRRSRARAHHGVDGAGAGRRLRAETDCAAVGCRHGELCLAEVELLARTGFVGLYEDEAHAYL